MATSEALKEIKWWEEKEKSGLIDTISKIESRTKPEVINILKNYGLGKIRRRKYQDYIEAKGLCFEGLSIDPTIYDRQISWICGYLKL